MSAKFLDNLNATKGKTITCKAAVAWEAKKPLDVTDIQVAPPKWLSELPASSWADGACNVKIEAGCGLSLQRIQWIYNQPAAAGGLTTPTPA